MADLLVFSSYLLLFFGFLTWLRLLLWVPAFSVANGEVSTGGPVANDLPKHSRVFSFFFPPNLLVFFGFYLSKASTEAAGSFCCNRWGSRRRHHRRRLFRSPEFRICFFHFRRGRLKCSRGSLLRLINMRGGCKRFVAIESKSFDLAIVGTAEDVLKIYENTRGRRTSLLLPENVALWLLRAWDRFYNTKSPNWCNQMRRGSNIFLLESKRNRVRKFLQLSVINKGKRTFVE
ncbi:hypothetical protein Cgig2_009281 [Carnegiea gigantea]|uniref:Uncharacterized protein n=1 Tax=Carnegiea gigantea TaxID=171969 RepID=A0A9Q1GMP5_9CARY|nr:hypothetical protein Cgig2_009281 [Carnegiea gigantea]